MGRRLVTAIVGAGPAGLLFALAGRILAEQRGLADQWQVRLFDKRAHYGRTHRLRMAPAAYRVLQDSLNDPRFDRLVAFLEAHKFSPEVNGLEALLSELVGELGVHKELLEIGAGSGQTSLTALRERLSAAEVLGPEDLFTVVAADSVHSSVREAVRGALAPERQTHEQLARLRVTGPDLPGGLGAVEQARLSRVLGSVVDYRQNANGYAEVDLFLSPPEFALVRDLKASPREPVKLSAQLLDRMRAPLFRAIVEHLESGMGQRRQVLLQSTFRLEHQRMSKLSFGQPNGASVFLLGDAGISLPFQRGMSCVAQCTLALAEQHVALLAGQARAEEMRVEYDRQAAAIVQRELRVVRSRAQIVRVLRELVRVSALLPFPIQSWWLRAPSVRRLPEQFSLWFFLNLAVALLAFGVACVGAWLSFGLWPALPLQVLGAIAYQSALSFETGTHRYVRRIWEAQLSALFLAGLAIFLAEGITRGEWRLGIDPFMSLVLAGAFVAGIYLFEGLVVHWFARAGLKFADGD